MIYAKIRMVGGGTYVQPISEVNVIVDEISEAAACHSVGRSWTIELVEMTPEEHAALPEFDGH